MCVVDAHNIVAVGTLGRIGVFNIFSGVWNWECLPVNFTLRHVVKINDMLWTVGDVGNIWRRRLPSGGWENVVAPDNGNFTGISGVEDGIIATTEDGKIYHQSMQTSAWKLLEHISGFRCGEPSSNGAITIVPAYDGRVARSSDNGKTWVVAKVTGYKLRTALVFSDSIVFVGGSAGRVFRSSDSGASFEEYALLPISKESGNEDNETEDTFWSLKRGWQDQILACGRMWIKRQFNENYQAVYTGNSVGTVWSKHSLSERIDSLDFSVFASPAIGAVMLDSNNGVCITSSNLHNSIGIHITTDAGKTWAQKQAWFAGLAFGKLDSTNRKSGFNVSITDATVSTDSAMFAIENRASFALPAGYMGNSLLVRYSQLKPNDTKRDTIGILPGIFTRLSMKGNRIAVFGANQEYAISSDLGRTWTKFDSITSFSETGAISRMLFRDNGELFALAAVVAKPAHSWGFNIPLFSSDGGKSWRVPEYNYQQGYTYGAFNFNELLNGNIVMNTLVQPTPAEAFQKLVQIDSKGVMDFLPSMPPQFEDLSRMQPVMISDGDKIIAIASQQWNVNGIEVNAMKRITYHPQTATWNVDSTYWRLNNTVLPPRTENWKYSNRIGKTIHVISQNSEMYTSVDDGINWQFIPKIVVSYDAEIDAVVTIGSRYLASGGCRLLYSFVVNDITSAVDEPSEPGVHRSLNDLCSHLGGSYRIYGVLGQILGEGNFLEVSELEGQLRAIRSNQLFMVEVLQECGRTIMKTFN
ncbi:MAG: hypothetical protein HQ472_05475 [Ignavibacteria bacterium]|nr:hypothetical protein [Ignavibacteria bacterium]